MSKNLSVQECLHVSRQNEEALCLAVSEHMMDISQKMAISANPQKVKKSQFYYLYAKVFGHIETMMRLILLSGVSIPAVSVECSAEYTPRHAAIPTSTTVYSIITVIGCYSRHTNKYK